MPKTQEKTQRVTAITGKSKIYLPDNRYPKELSVMQNRMIEAWNSMNIDEKRIFVLASPLIRLCKATEQTCFSITAKDYAKACNLSVGSAYHQLKSAADTLRGRYFSYINTAGKRVSVHWVIRIEYSDAEISFYFPDEVLFMLSIFNKDNPYTRFSIETALNLRGAHALHFYQLFKQHELIGYREFKLEDFRNIFELKEKYKVFSNLRVRMIEPSLCEINEKTDLTVSFIPLTKGKKIVGLRFEISGQSKNIKTVKSEKSSSKKSEKKITATMVYKEIIKNSDLLVRFRESGEAINEMIDRIKEDFKNGNQERWINKLQEFGITFEETAPF